MVYRVVSTKLNEDEHNKLLDACNRHGCTPSALVREAITEKIENEENPKQKTGKSENTEDVGARKVLLKTSDETLTKEPKVEERRQPTLEEAIDHMKNCSNPSCKHGRINLMKNL